MVNRHVFLSPHLDDVVLSCGGLLAILSDANVDLSVISIFAGMPDPAAPISAFAAYQHDMWGNPQQAYQTRRAEDSAALAVFECKPVWLDFFDCIYRGSPKHQAWYYNSDDDIFGSLHPAEIDSVPAIVNAIQQALKQGKSSAIEEEDQNTKIPKYHSTVADTIIYSPLTVGRHVDHQLTFLAALQLLTDGYTVYFYEEFPYVDRDSDNLATALYETTPMLLKRLPAVAKTLDQVALTDIWQNEIRRFSKAALSRKIEATAAYRTQLDVLFGGETAMANRVTAYAEYIGQADYGERLWHLAV